MYLVNSLIIILSVLHTSLAEYEVTTNNGLIGGVKSTYRVQDSDTVVIEYRGIPYAQPPTGVNRFKPPQTVQNWNAFNATEYGNACPQDSDLLDASLDGRTTYDNIAVKRVEIDEDCLYLNIYRPYYSESVENKQYAVMVFFHGGNFVSGSGMAYAGNVLSSVHDVIVVTVNYRLGALGFLSDGGSTLPGNYGLLDQQMALKWIRDNIQAFGGDYNRTIFGSDAGASSVHLHTLIESSSSFFQRAIVQSASYNDAVWTKGTARGQYETLLQNLGISADSSNILGQLQNRNLTWQEIQEALPGPWQPVIGSLIPQQPRDLMVDASYNKGKDILVGSNNLDSYQIVTSEVDVTADNWYYDAVRDITSMTSDFNTWTDDDINKRMIMFNQYYVGFGSNLGQFWDGYQASMIPEQFRNGFEESMIAEIYTDQLYGTWAHEIAMSSNVRPCNMYKYLFQSTPPDAERAEAWAYSGATHGDELPYIFGFMTKPLDYGATLEDAVLSMEVMDMWTGFAKTGRLPMNFTATWNMFSAYSASDSCRSTIYIDVSSTKAWKDLPTSRNWDFWNNYYNTLGLSCAAGSSEGGTDPTKPDEEECESGVWSDAGVVMSNDTAGALLITFIVLTAVFLLAFLCSCHRWNKAKRKIKKVIGDDVSSVISNSSTRM